ncbi:MAG: Asp-tRNA(Asn)/Glu-tRNA(Gln) amidotransferase subunit GatC [bacterium]|nr:Asp-tRNA(Asn)/Glu-tRNA(Gln) amidotransferase subunit GatC [bacterium]
MIKKSTKPHITPEVVENTARLARLELSDERRKTLPAELAKIFDYISQLSEIDTKGVEPTAHPTGETNAFADDVAKPCGMEHDFFTSPKP